MNFKERELWLGISEPAFRKKFVFEGQETPEAFFFDRLQPTPSELDGLSELDEDRARSIACQMLIEAGVFLKLPVTTVVAAQTILHFFYQRCSLLKHDFRDIVMGAMFLAGKCEETLRRSAHIALVFDQVFKVHLPLTKIHERERRPVRVADVNNYEFKCMQAKVLETERLILFELGFEVHRLLETPHRYMNILFLEFNRHKRINEIVKKAWGYLNDSFRTRVCVHYPGQIIAAACVHLSLRQLGIPAPTVPWWCLMEASKELMEAVAADILSLYERCDTFSVVQEALTRAGNAKNIQHVFPVTYYRRILLGNREAQKLKQQAKQLELKPVSQSQQGSSAPSVQQKSVLSAHEVVQPSKPTASIPQSRKQAERSRTRSRSNRKDKHKKKKHRHRSRSRESSRDSRDHRRKSRSRSKNSRRRRDDSRDSRDRRRKKQRKERRSRSSEEESKQNKSPALKEPGSEVVEKQPEQHEKSSEVPVVAQEPPSSKPALDKVQIMKQIQEQMKARQLKKPEPVPTSAVSQPPLTTPDTPTKDHLPQEHSMMAELKAKILRRKQQAQSAAGPDNISL